MTLRPFKLKRAQVRLRQYVRAFRLLRPFLILIWRVHPRYAAANAALRLIKAIIPVGMLWIGKLIIDRVVALTQDEASAEEVEQLWWLVAAELALALISDIANRGVSLLEALLGDLFSNYTSVQLLEHAARLDLAQFENPRFYDKMERARRQTSGRTQLMGNILSQVQEMVSLVSLGVGLVVYNPWLVLILVIAIIPSLISEVHFNQRNYALTQQWTPERRQLDYLRWIGANDFTAKEIKSYNLSPFLIDRFRRLADQYYLANKKLVWRRNQWGSALNALGTLAYYFAFVLILRQTLQGEYSVGDLTFLSGSFSRMRNLLQTVANRFSRITNDALYLEDFFAFFRLQPDTVTTEGELAVPRPFREGIRFENVGFRYPGTDVWAVRHLSFSIAPDEKVAVVGENGAGKTTLVKLLARLYEPEEGHILLDGLPLHAYRAEEVREAISLVFQDYVRYSFTAEENIRVGASGQAISRAQLDEAAERSLARRVIERFPQGYEQMLGRRFNGLELSGGEWQRLALARLYARRPELFILDEPTAALDARSEQQVFEHFSQQTQGKAAVLISHRFSTVRMADRILYLAKGRLLEEGTHEQLMALGGRYAELFDLQARAYH